jgi:hypothetical protein
VKVLPAAVAAPTTISAVTIPASATSATAPAAWSPTPATPSKASSAAAASSASSALSRWPGFVYDDIAAHKIVAIQTLNGALGLVVAIDFDKPEPAWLARETVAHQGDIRRGDSRLRK